MAKMAVAAQDLAEAPPWPSRPLLHPTPRQICSWLRRHLPARDFELQGWYREVIGKAWGPLDPVEVLVSIAMGNGKTTLGAALEVFELLGRGIPRDQVLSLATSMNQAALCYRQAVDLIFNSPTLRPWVRRAWTGGYERYEVPQLGSFMTLLPARDARVVRGYTPGLAVVDEVGFIDDDVYDAMSNAVTKRPHAKLLSIGTPGFDQHGTMYRLRTLAREQKPRGLAFMEWAAPDGCQVDDRKAWRAANPGIPRVKTMAKMEHALTTNHEAVFRTFQLGQWVGQMNRWLPWGAMGRLERRPAPEEGEQAVLGFDGSESGDSTALYWGTLEGVGRVEVWERIEEPGWRVPRRQVVETVLEAFRRWNVKMLACDPSGWRSELEEIEREVGPERVHRIRVFQYSEVAPACDRFWQAVVDRKLSWDGDDVLARHAGNAVPVPTRYGTAIAKKYPSSKDRIDAVVAAVYAYEWAARLLPPQKQIDVRKVIG
jgi:phage terminase large subunit-like protein